jgi:hypothetical protein
MSVVTGVIEAGLITTQFPAASAGAIFHEAMIMASKWKLPMIDVIENDIDAKCLGLGADLLREEIDEFR